MTKITKFPRMHIKALLRDARAAARFNGHELGRWHTYDSSWAIREARCKACGALARVDGRNPHFKSEPTAFGDAMTQACQVSKPERRK